MVYQILNSIQLDSIVEFKSTLKEAKKGENNLSLEFSQEFSDPEEEFCIIKGEFTIYTDKQDDGQV